jgi:superoxide reductase
MQRRNLAKTALAGAAAAVAMPIVKRADAAPDQYTNVIFTAENPGHWAALAALHVPVITVDGSTLTVHTPHPMTEPHYIVSHTVVLADGTYLDRKTFTWKDQPVSVHTLPAGYKGNVTVTSTCNLHDWWVKIVTV